MFSCRTFLLLALLLVTGAALLAVVSFTPSFLKVASALRANPPTAAPSATPSPRPSRSPTIPPTRAATPTSTSRPVPASTAPATPGPFIEHFLFDRPLAPDAPAPAPNRHYLYGTTEHAEYEVHHGVDFDNNPIGTPLIAVGDGIVVTAGDDRKPLCGDRADEVCGRYLKFYGLVTVIRLDASYRGQALFALYGHMDRVDVETGQRVTRGQKIGTVGMTGIAIGPHVQFEIRLGTNDYASTVNPMLWIRPQPGRGVLAGRYTDKTGKPVRSAIIDLYRQDAPDRLVAETETYSRDAQPDVNSDAELRENFLFNDISAGEFILRIAGTQHQHRITVTDGRVAFVDVSGR